MINTMETHSSRIIMSNDAQQVFLLFDLSLFVWLGFYATFNNISVITQWSVLLVEEAGLPEEI